MILFAWFWPNYTAFVWFVCVFDWTIMCLRATTVTVSPCHAPLYPPPRIPSLYPRAMLVLDPTLMRLVSPVCFSTRFTVFLLYLCFAAMSLIEKYSFRSLPDTSCALRLVVCFLFGSTSMCNPLYTSQKPKLCSGLAG